MSSWDRDDLNRRKKKLTADSSAARTVVLVSLRAFGTMLAIYIRTVIGCAWGMAKSNPVSLGAGKQSAEEG